MPKNTLTPTAKYTQKAIAATPRARQTKRQRALQTTPKTGTNNNRTRDNNHIDKTTMIQAAQNK